MANLKDIRARLAAQDNKNNRTNSNDGNGPVYLHWKIKEGETAIVRFLDDANTDNSFFWVERAMFKLPFNGIVGDPSAGNVVVQVPCMEMYEKKCAVLDEVRTWFKDDSMEDMGRKYWKKRSYIFQGFVHSDPLNGETPENPIRRFMISPQIFGVIKNSLLDPEMENSPTDMVAGLDFRINKTDQGGQGNYTTSAWSRKETGLTVEELEAIEKHGLEDLSKYLPAEPSADVQKVIMEMFEASVDGEAYDPEKWGAYYTPPGVAKTGNNTGAKAEAKTATTPVVTKVEEPTTEAAKASTEIFEEKAEVVVEAKVEETVTEAPAQTGDKAADILAMIRNRQK